MTTEILNLGIASKNQWPIGVGALCADPSPNAVIRLQRLRDSADGNCYYSAAGANSLNANDYWPNALYDTREGNLRDANAAASETMSLAGGMYTVELDVTNLKKYFAGAVAPYNALATNGNTAQNNNGFIVYFSDRRNNSCPNGTPAPCEAASGDSGEYGFEDVVNPADVNGAPNGVLDTGEDVNANGVLDTYGQTPVNLPAGAALPLTGARVYNTTVGGTQVNAAHLHGQPSDLLPPRAEDHQRHAGQPARAGPDDRGGKPGLRSGRLQRHGARRSPGTRRATSRPRSSPTR